jgi:hypothetical protein
LSTAVVVILSEFAIGDLPFRGPVPFVPLQGLRGTGRSQPAVVDVHRHERPLTSRPRRAVSLSGACAIVVSAAKRALRREQVAAVFPKRPATGLRPIAYRRATAARRAPHRFSSRRATRRRRRLSSSVVGVCGGFHWRDPREMMGSRSNCF